MNIDDVRQALLDIIRDEAWRGKTWLLQNPRRVGKKLSTSLRPRNRVAFSARLAVVLADAGYQSLSPLVVEQVREYFRLLQTGGVEPRLVRRGGF